MKIQLEAADGESTRLICLIITGIVTALEQGTLTIEAAEQCIFNPYTMRRLTELGADPRVIDLIHAGTELEDIQSLVPESLSKMLHELRQDSLNLLKSLPEDAVLSKWLKSDQRSET